MKALAGVYLASAVALAVAGCHYWGRGGGWLVAVGLLMLVTFEFKGKTAA